MKSYKTLDLGIWGLARLISWCRNCFGSHFNMHRTDHGHLRQMWSSPPPDHIWLVRYCPIKCAKCVKIPKLTLPSWDSRPNRVRIEEEHFWPHLTQSQSMFYRGGTGSKWPNEFWHFDLWPILSFMKIFYVCKFVSAILPHYGQHWSSNRFEFEVIKRSIWVFEF